MDISPGCRQDVGGVGVEDCSEEMIVTSHVSRWSGGGGPLGGDDRLVLLKTSRDVAVAVWARERG